MTIGRPLNAENCTYFNWIISHYNVETKEWESKKYSTIKEYERETNDRLGRTVIMRLLRRDQEFDPNKVYSPKAFWTRNRYRKVEKIHEPIVYIRMAV